MSLATLDLVCRRVFESPLIGRRLDVAWHGGEPLVVPVGWYDEAIGLMAKRSPSGLELRHCFQTNGLLVNEDWARFFARTEARVGLSIDGPADLHDAARSTRGGQGTHARAMQALRLLQDRGLAFHVITVLTERTLDDPERLFDFYVENGIKEVGFNIEEIEGAHRSSSLAARPIEVKFRQFMRRFFELIWDEPGNLKLRELETALGLILSNEPVVDQQNLPFAILSVTHDGAMSTFSPELSGTHHPRFGGFGFGHVATHELSEIEHTPLFRAVSSEIELGVKACERSCPYFRWCGGGAPANKLFETGRFDATETMHCRLTRQVVLDEAIASLESRIRSNHNRHNVSHARAS